MKNSTIQIFHQKIIIKYSIKKYIVSTMSSCLNGTILPYTKWHEHNLGAEYFSLLNPKFVQALRIYINQCSFSKPPSEKFKNNF